MTNKNILLLLIVVAISIVACNNNIASKGKTLWGEVLVKITISSLENSSISDSKKTPTFVYGSIEIKGEKKTINTVDLECIIMRIDGIQSKKLYIDSVAHILTSNYPANNNLISVDVYWKFDKIISPDSLKTFDYIARDTDIQKCVSFK